MLNLSRKLEDNLIIGNVVYPLDLSFGKVLRVFELLQDTEIQEEIKPYLALQMLTGANFSNFDLMEVNEILEEVFKAHIVNEKTQAIEYDLMGNPMPVQEKKEEERVYSLKYDADYIFASFFQAYGIDLIEERQKLHWKKFNALLNGLPSDTKFMEVLKIRSWKPRKGDSAEYKEDMRKLQQEYELPYEED